MRTDKRHRMAIRLSTEVLTALRLSAERSGLPEATQAMVLLRQALARTMDSKEYADRLALARGQRTRGDFLEDLALAAEGLALEQAQEGNSPDTATPAGGGRGGSQGGPRERGQANEQHTHAAVEEEA